MRSRYGAFLLDRYDVDRLDGRFGGQQVGSDFTQGRRNAALQVGGTRPCRWAERVSSVWKVSKMP